MRTTLILLLLAVPGLALAQATSTTPKMIVANSALAINACTAVQMVLPGRPGPTASGQPWALANWNLTVTPRTSPSGSVVWSNSSTVARTVCACKGAVAGDAVRLLATWVVEDTRYQIGDPRRNVQFQVGTDIGVVAAASVAPAPGCPTLVRPTELVRPAQLVRPLLKP